MTDIRLFEAEKRTPSSVVGNHLLVDGSEILWCVVEVFRIQDIFAALWVMDAGLEGCAITTAELKEKIYRFINKYSHSDVIEITEESAENLAGESHSVLNNIFQWIEEVDKKHFDEMVEVAQEA